MIDTEDFIYQDQMLFSYFDKYISTNTLKVSTYAYGNSYGINPVRIKLVIKKPQNINNTKIPMDHSDVFNLLNMLKPITNNIKENIQHILDNPSELKTIKIHPYQLKSNIFISISLLYKNEHNGVCAMISVLDSNSNLPSNVYNISILLN